MMTGIYVRKRTPFMEIRGLAHSSENEPTIQDTAAKPVHPALSYITENTNSSEDLNSNYEEHSFPSGRSSLSEMGSQETLSVSNCWASGNSTERSSIDSTYSWTNDEFDRHAARNVAQLFDEIDSILFEGSTNGPDNAFKECNEWVKKFPHLRVLGKQLQAPHELGYVAIPQKDSRNSHLDSILNHSTDVDKELDAVLGDDYITESNALLTVEGHSLTAKLPPPTLPKDLHYLYEEVLAQEGYYEEIFAIDSSDQYEDQTSPNRRKPILPRWKRQGLPPVTPNACLQDSIMSTVFDYIWQEVFEWTGDLIKKYSGSIQDNKVEVMSLMQQTPSLDDLSQQQIYLLDNKGTSSQSFGAEMKPSQLDDLLTVSRKELVLREKSNLHDISESPLTVSSRPFSVTSRQRPLRPPSIQRDLSDHLLSSSALKRGAGHSVRAGVGIRLTPLAPHILDRSRTPSVEDTRSLQMQNEVLVGHRLITGPDEIASPTSVIPRHSTLPPLDIPKRTHRASSALVSDKETRLSYKERYLQLQEPINRPSTTHAFRSDTPLGSVTNRRSSTPMGIYTLTTRTQPLGRNKYLGITGSGLQPPGDLDQIEQEDEEEVRFPSPVALHTHQQWTPMTAAPRNNRYSRGKLLTSYLRV